MSRIKTENLDIDISIPLSAINTLSLQAIGLYVTLHIFGKDVELEDVEDTLNSIHGSRNVGVCLAELNEMGFIDITTEDKENGDSEGLDREGV
jgi:hypothetical protein